jgi:hypothetical protein
VTVNLELIWARQTGRREQPPLKCHGAVRVSVGAESVPETTCGSMDSQVEELDADGYAAYLLWTFLLRSERRQRALIELGQANMPTTDCDELILSCFFWR